MSDSTGAAPGFYGKAPALGDFVARRLPPGFLREWDRFLAGLVQQSRTVLGRAWLAAWNEAPLWRFGLGAGIAGPEPWFGVLIPSVDRVGRQFPFTVLGPSAPGGVAHPAWSLAAEALALGALEDGFDPPGLADALAALGPPRPPAEGDEAEVLAGVTVWSCRPTPRLPATLMRCAGLPSPVQSVRLVAGEAD